MPEQLIQERLASLTPEYRSFVESEFTTDAAGAFGEALAFTERQVEILENALMLYLLFFLNGTETVDFISRNCEVSLPEATDLFLSIQSTLPMSVVSAINLGYISVHGQNGEATEELATELAETEQAFAALQGIRTMASDIQAMKSPEEPVYRSTQSDILRPTAPTTQPADSRWETDR